MATLTFIFFIFHAAIFVTVKSSSEAALGPAPYFLPELPAFPPYSLSPGPEMPVYPPYLSVIDPTTPSAVPAYYYPQVPVPGPDEPIPIYSPPMPSYRPIVSSPALGPSPEGPVYQPPLPVIDPTVPAPSLYPPIYEPVPISSPVTAPGSSSYPPADEAILISSPPMPDSPSPVEKPDPEAPVYQSEPEPSPSPYPAAPVYPSEPEPSPSPYPGRAGGIKAAYWASFNGFPASSIDSSYFTHIFYAFLLPDPVTFKLNITSFDQTKLPEFMGSLRGQSPPVKTMLSIGGGGSNSTVFSQMASTRKTRLIFINSTIEVARNYGFDGVDLDWEYPDTVHDMSNLAILYKEWRKALHDESKTRLKPRLVLTSAVYYSSIVTLNGVIRAYPAAAIREYVDWINPMCYDYHGVWENTTGQHSALYDLYLNSKLSTNYGIWSWIQAGVPPKKLVMGLAAYGHTWKLKDPSFTRVGAEAVGPGPGGESGLLGYDEIKDFNLENNATVKFDIEAASYYSYAGGYWIGYDDAGSILLKVRYARAMGLGGYFFWALGTDKSWTLSFRAAKAWEY